MITCVPESLASTFAAQDANLLADNLRVRSAAALTGRARRRRYGSWSGAAVDECGEAVEQALQAELEQILQIEVVIASGEALEDGEAARLHD